MLYLGFNSGFNAIAYNKILPNLEKIYAFEPIYDRARIPFVEDFIINDKLEIFPYAIGDKDSMVKFLINKQVLGSSYCVDASSRTDEIENNIWQEITVKATTIDTFCEKNNVKPDFIKMDIEGAEMAALKGGMKTIKKYRPQLAISIYHSDSDFIKIPLYLSENLQNYIFKLGHYSTKQNETVLYAIPKEKN